MTLTRICALAATAALLAGCAGLTPPFEVSAFGPDKVYAVVSIYSEKEVEAGETETLTGMLGAIRGDGAYFYSADAVLRESTPLIVDEFAGVGSYRLMPPRQVLNHAAYRAFAADEQPRLQVPRLVADGYKYIWNPERLGQLARDLDVDGVAVVYIRYGYKFWGTNFAGIGADGWTAPDIRMETTFIDRNGQAVWRHQVHNIMRDGPPAVAGDLADPDAMHPLFVEASVLSAQSLLGSLERRTGALSASTR
ncbi:MAG: hypothetical protein HKM95_01385 [Inquilinus sp.]|nr:hypothetical protein [Inquilinus sp.]